MKIYEITIKPLTGFGTPLKGDTIFGHFCWQLFYDKNLIGGKLDFDEAISSYIERPFIIFSSAYPKFCIGDKYLYAFRTPSLPPERIFSMPVAKKEKIKMRKEFKAKKWMLVKEMQKFSSFRELDFIDDGVLNDKVRKCLTDDTSRLLRCGGCNSIETVVAQPHNSINRITGTTCGGNFAPFAMEYNVFIPETELALFVGFDDKVISIEQIKTGLETIGDTGFGRDASTGQGRFQLAEEQEINLSAMGSDKPDGCYTLAPCVPEQDTFQEMFFTPFTRFGRHGDVLAKSANPFKNPIVMADEGAVLIPKNSDTFAKPYIGRAVNGISNVERNSVAQGYTLYLPVQMEV